MYLRVRDPVGRVTCLALAELPVFRLALQRVPFPGQAPGEWTCVGLTVEYLAGGTVTWMIVAAVDLTKSVEAEQVAKVGLPGKERGKNRARIIEACRILHNTDMKSEEVGAIERAAVEVVDLYHDLMDVLWGPKAAPSALDTLSGPLFARDVGDWTIGVTSTPFEPWLVQKAVMPAGETGVGPSNPPPPMTPPAPPKKANPSREQRRQSNRDASIEPPVLDPKSVGSSTVDTSGNDASGNDDDASGSTPDTRALGSHRNE